jgi:hypothetical protein
MWVFGLVAVVLERCFGYLMRPPSSSITHLRIRGRAGARREEKKAFLALAVGFVSRWSIFLARFYFLAPKEGTKP